MLQKLFLQWVPIFRENSLQTGLFELPVTTDPPSSEARQHSTESSAPALSTLKVYLLYILILNPKKQIHTTNISYFKIFEYDLF